MKTIKYLVILSAISMALTGLAHKAPHKANKHHAHGTDQKHHNVHHKKADHKAHTNKAPKKKKK
ncbi:MAG TPA: hypothetical protein VEL47_02195 [Myxococcota bacterium]|nr:hypothetical protein [Myxococcota bacterium]